jgi:hypothetical protein
VNGLRELQLDLLFKPGPRGHGRTPRSRGHSYAPIGWREPSVGRERVGQRSFKRRAVGRPAVPVEQPGGNRRRLDRPRSKFSRAIYPRTLLAVSTMHNPHHARTADSNGRPCRSECLTSPGSLSKSLLLTFRGSITHGSSVPGDLNLEHRTEA